LKEIIDDKTIIVCIGTDLHAIDSIGPLLGSLLKDRDISIPLLGTLDDPIHALNIQSKVGEIYSQYSGHKIIAVDGCLCDGDDIGNIRIKSGGINAGEGIGKEICTEIGDIIKSRKNICERL
jgi:putative sporulation protein YyaC